TLFSTAVARLHRLLAEGGRAACAAALVSAADLVPAPLAASRIVRPFGQKDSPLVRPAPRSDTGRGAGRRPAAVGRRADRPVNCRESPGRGVLDHLQSHLADKILTDPAALLLQRPYDVPGTRLHAEPVEEVSDRLFSGRSLHGEDVIPLLSGDGACNA